ncbi:response regulator [Lacticaseibacillus rhamnosus]|uniref:response regulator transcription factor n=1 Tax=Lacticaseibacillus rhamnosus TaxID=47715 RepID=UPI00214B473E|nr:response regulator [Lacticaseibacillus rhamnosus]UUT39442.1 response regulator [Lacticaseibacillus rhamnosus]
MYKLLVVEDEHLIRCYLTGALDYQELNIEVVGDAENGQEGAKKIKKLHPDIVLTDISMPVMDAFTMFEATKEQEYQKVILSGYNDFANDKRAIRSGARDFLVKPIDLAELRNCMVDVVTQIQEQRGQVREADNLPIDLLKDVRYSRDHVVTKVLEWISQHYACKFTIAEMASELGYSESYIYKKIKDHLGITLNDYLNCYRIRMAINHLIEDPGMLVYEAADLTGFSDYKYFNQVFKKYFGMTVTDFKDKVLQ